MHLGEKKQVAPGPGSMTMSSVMASEPGAFILTKEHGFEVIGHPLVGARVEATPLSFVQAQVSSIRLLDASRAFQRLLGHWQRLNSTARQV